MDVSLSPKQIFKKNLYLIFFLISANIFGIFSKYYLNDDMFYGLIPLFDLDTEQNFPTYYSSVALLVASILLWIISFSHKKLKSPYIMWSILSFIFLYLSVDELVSLHERVGELTRSFVDTSGLLYYTWVLPYGVVVIIFILTYLKFLFELPKKTAILFFISAIIFVTGAMGFEMLGGRQDDLHGYQNILYTFYYTCEESLEMISIAIFIYALLSYIANQFGSITTYFNQETNIK